MLDRDRPITPRRNPFELWIVITCAFTGAVALLPIGRPREAAIDRYLPVLALPWYVGLLLGGVITAIGAVWRVRTVRGAVRMLAFERVGLIVLCGLMFGYGGALVVVTLRSPAGLLLLGLAVASAVRVHQINREVAAIENALKDAQGDDNDTT